MRRVWRHDMPRPSPPRVGAVAPRAAESADGNGAAVSHAQYVPTMTAAAVLPVGGAAPRTFAPGGIGNCTATAYTPYAVNDKSVATLRVVSIISRAVFLLYAYVCTCICLSTVPWLYVRNKSQKREFPSYFRISIRIPQYDENYAHEYGVL